MKKTIAVLILLASCSPSEPAPMSGLCVDRVAPNLFDATAADVLFKECKWQSQKWLCRLERGSRTWRCVAVK